MMRTSESKGHYQLYDSSAALEPEVRNRTCRTMCANFGFAALAGITASAAFKAARSKPHNGSCGSSSRPRRGPGGALPWTGGGGKGHSAALVVPEPTYVTR